MSVTRIKSVVYHWMSFWDINTGEAVSYSVFPTVVKTDDHIVHSIDVSDLNDGTVNRQKAPIIEFVGKLHLIALDYEPFAIDRTNTSRKDKGVVGIGWGDKARSGE